MLEVLLRIVQVPASEVCVTKLDVQIQRPAARDRLFVLVDRFLLVAGYLVVQLLEARVIIGSAVSLPAQGIALAHG